MSFRISLPPHKRAAARFVGKVSRELQKALAEEEARCGLKQADIARTLDIDRATVTRQIHGQQNMTLARVAELASAMGRRAEIGFPAINAPAGSNVVNLNITVRVDGTMKTAKPLLLDQSASGSKVA